MIERGKLHTGTKLIALIAVCAMFVVGLCNGQSPSAPGVKRVATGLVGFSIPFKIDNPDPSHIEVQLYLSMDKGNSWSFYQAKSPSANGFDFQAKGDGEYWFAIKTLDRNRQLIPSGNVVRVELQVIVDTVKPVLDFSVEADAAGRAVASWKVTDLNIDPASLKLSYRAADVGGSGEAWKTVQFEATNLNILNDAWSDQVAWWPQTFSRQLEVKMEIADTAGNLVSAVRPITVRDAALPRRESSSTSQRNPFYPSAHNALFVDNNTGSSNQDLTCRDGICSPQQPPAQASAEPAPQASGAQAVGKPGLLPAWQGRKGRSTPVGSPSELVDPPPPEPAVQAARNERARVPKVGGAVVRDTTAIEWESKTDQWTQRCQTGNSTTPANNDFPIVPRDSVEIRQGIPQIPAMNRGQDRDQSAGSNQLATGPSASQGDNLFISESTAVGRAKPQQISDSRQADHSIAAGPLQSQHTVDQRSETENFEPDRAPKLPPNSSSIADGPNGNQQQQLVSASHPRVNTEPNYDSGSPIPKLTVNSRRFNLNYDIRAIDPSGVGRVILWATEDGGRSWKSWATDPDNSSPFPVDVQAEATYGFKVVINSRDGLTGKSPLSGDPPDVWVQVDLTIPEVAITSAPYGSGRDAGKLIINFSANDLFLTLRPIKLDYSPNPTGPWTTIETALRNTGSYAWKVPSQVPEQIYLRLEARDTADNVGAYQLTAPVDISGLVPRGRIYSVDPIRQ